PHLRGGLCVRGPVRRVLRRRHRLRRGLHLRREREPARVRGGRRLRRRRGLPRDRDLRRERPPDPVRGRGRRRRGRGVLRREVLLSAALYNLHYLSDDATPDGSVDYEYTFTWDVDRLLTQDYVDYSPGANDVHYELTYDAQDRAISASYVETRHSTGAVSYE